MSEVYAIALHGGAGVQPGRDYSAAIAHLDALAREAAQWLSQGLSALDVVERAVAEMENAGLYVAGRGSAPNTAGYVELDASIMDGARRRGGAVAAARDLKNPVIAARRVMERTPHVLIAGLGVTDFARAEGLEIIADPDAYYVLPAGVERADVERAGAAAGRAHGTVGAAALDRDGRLAAATSTGGVFGKLPGRIGDTPLIGSGVWADEEVAVSCTGLGESFILAGGAQDVAARVRYLGQSLPQAADGLIADVARIGGDGGVIAVNRRGEVAFAFNTPGMKRAAATSSAAAFATI